MKKILHISFILFCTYSLNAQVGINTANPQEEVHVAGATSTIRIEGLNSPNNPLNIGANGTSRVFADADGDLVLGPATSNIEVLFSPFDYLLSTEDNASCFNQTGQGSGYQIVGTPKVPGNGTSYFTLTKNAIVELNYALSWHLQKNNTRNLDDGAARIIQTYVILYNMDTATIVSTNLDGSPIILGGALGLNGQFYTNNIDSDGANQIFHNVGTDYVSLSPGRYHPFFFAQVAVSSASGTGAIQICFGKGNDELQIVAHYYN